MKLAHPRRWIASSIVVVVALMCAFMLIVPGISPVVTVSALSSTPICSGTRINGAQFYDTDGNSLGYFDDTHTNQTVTFNKVLDRIRVTVTLADGLGTMETSWYSKVPAGTNFYNTTDWHNWARVHVTMTAPNGNTTNMGYGTWTGMQVSGVPYFFFMMGGYVDFTGLAYPFSAVGAYHFNATLELLLTSAP